MKNKINKEASKALEQYFPSSMRKASEEVSHKDCDPGIEIEKVALQLMDNKQYKSNHLTHFEK